MSLLGGTQVIIRGATVQFATTFYDVDGLVVQPDMATVRIVPAFADDPPVEIAMAPPSGSSTQWKALWDTRDVQAPQAIYWSIHTGSMDPIPVTAEDGSFLLSANPANLLTF